MNPKKECNVLFLLKYKRSKKQKYNQTPNQSEMSFKIKLSSALVVFKLQEDTER